MLTGPKGQNWQCRPVMRIATGEEEDTLNNDGKDPAAKRIHSFQSRTLTMLYLLF